MFSGRNAPVITASRSSVKGLFASESNNTDSQVLIKVNIPNKEIWLILTMTSQHQLSERYDDDWKENSKMNKLVEQVG